MSARGVSMNLMLIAYIDDSGNSGEHTLGGATPYYALGCVLLDADSWPASFDQMLAFRRSLKAGTFNIPVRAELKANYLIRGSGPLLSLGLSTSQRQLVYRYHLNMVAALGGRAFTVVIDKQPNNRHGAALREFAWTTLIQRLERTSHYDDQRILIVHDEGENDEVRKQVRKARRYLTAGSAVNAGQVIQLAATGFVEDPIPRSSQQSYFIQLADMVAYAGWRKIVAPGSSIARVVPQEMWDQLGLGVHSAVNRTVGGVPGIVFRQ